MYSNLNLNFYLNSISLSYTNFKSNSYFVKILTTSSSASTCANPTFCACGAKRELRPQTSA